MKKSAIVGIVVGGAMIVGLTAVGAALLLRQPEGCDSLSTSAGVGGEGTEHRLVVELDGNSDSWQDEVGSFVDTELSSSGGQDPEKPLAVNVVFVEKGVTMEPLQTCLRGPVLLQAGEGDRRTLETASPSTRSSLLAEMAKTRDRQIGWIVDAVREEVATADFSKVEGEPISPVPVWSVAGGPKVDPESTLRVSIYSPMASTAKDCLNGDGSESDPKVLVADCIQFDQLTILGAEITNVVVASVANPTQPQQLAAKNMAAALCALATSDGCSGGRSDS